MNGRKVPRTDDCVGCALAHGCALTSDASLRGIDGSLRKNETNILNSIDLTREFSKNLATGSGAIFVGSGISAPSSAPSWLTLLQEMARTRLNLEIDSDDDLPLIAQYIVNQANGNRGPLIQHFREALARPLTLNEYHAALSRTNVNCLWTTNYDTLLEDAFRRHFHVSVKASDDAIARSVASSEIEIVKMHGCIEQSMQDDIVATQEDYEEFFSQRPATAQRLSQDLLDKSFLFIGYAYGDSNINNILVEARRLAQRATRQHFIVLSRINDGDEQRKKAEQARQDFWLGDLARVGIEACQIDHYGELQNILDRISLGSRGSTVFVTGSHSRSEENATHLNQLGKLLADEPGLILLDGQSTGTSRFLVSAYLERCIERRIDVLTKLRVFSNPYAANPRFSNDSSLLPLLQKWRHPLLRAAQIVVVYHGGMGTEAEVKVAKELGCRIVPVPECDGDLPSLFLANDVEIQKVLKSADPSYFAKAKNRQVTAQDVLNCIQAIIKK